jgi:hypothetical protein
MLTLILMAPLRKVVQEHTPLDRDEV